MTTSVNYVIETLTDSFKYLCTDIWAPKILSLGDNNQSDPDVLSFMIPTSELTYSLPNAVLLTYTRHQMYSKGPYEKK